MHRLDEHLAAKARVLHETVDPLVAAHDDMSDRIKPQARSLATADASIKQIDISRDISKDWIERLVEKLEPRHLRIVQTPRRRLVRSAASIRAMRNASRSRCSAFRG